MTRGKCSRTLMRRVWLWLLIGLLFTTGILLPGSAVGADKPVPTPASEQPTQLKIPTAGTLLAAQEVEGPSSSNPKLGSSLNQLLETHRREGLAEAQAFATRRVMVLDDDRVQVVMVTTREAISDLKEALEVLGGEYQGHYEGLLQASVPIDALESLAGRPDVQLVREPLRPIPLAPAQVGNQTTEGVAASNASAWHAAGHTGSGVRIAVIDTGFTGYTGLLGTDLPASVTTYDWFGLGMDGLGNHGTACAEIIYDMAPGATMYLHVIGTEVELGQAVTQAIADGVDVISMSQGWIAGGPGDGTGFLADIVNDARSNGIFFAVAAGNDAEVSWSGSYVNSGTSNYHAWDGADLWYNFIVPSPGSGDCYIPPADTFIQAGLHWDDWSAVSQDYDLHLYSSPDGSTMYRVASSTNPQNGGGGQTPEEYVSYRASGTDCYAFVVERVSATRDVCLSLAVPQMLHLAEWVSQRSLSFPADSPDAITVGAVDVSSPYPLESYSSQGPTFGPGGTCSGGSTKPDIAAYANVSTESYGAGGFSRTSAATPHVAGAAALVQSSLHRFDLSSVCDPELLQCVLENGAVDLGTAGKDNLYGSGRLYLGDPPPDSTAASIPFYDDYEPCNSPYHADCYAYYAYTTNEGRVRVSSDYPHSGAYSLLLDDSDANSTYSHAALILTIDLSVQSQVDLDFWWRGFGDEDHPDDGVFISDDDGANWYQVLSFNGAPTSYRNDVVDIDAAAAANGLTLNDHFQIKFQFYDNYPVPSDGYAIDDVQVTGPALAPPTITGITPSSGNNNGVVHVTNLAGSGFQTGAEVTLKMGQAVISATNVSASGSKITCDFDLWGVSPGQWTVRVTNPDSEYVELIDGFTVNGLFYLPGATRCYPLATYLDPIDNSDGDGVYTLNWSWPSCAPSPSYYQLQGDTDSQFGSPDSFTESDTSFEAYSPTPGTYYWRVRAYISGTGWSEWSNVQSTQVTSSRAYVWVDNDTGGDLTVEIVGIEKKSFSSGYHYWRSISPGRYTYNAWAWCGSGSWTEDFIAGENVLSFWCSYGVASTSKAVLGSGVQAIEDLNAVR